MTHFSLAFKQLRSENDYQSLLRWWWWAHPAHLPELTLIYASLSWAYLAQRFILLRDISKKSNSLYSLGAYVCHYGQNNRAHYLYSLLSVPRLAFPSSSRYPILYTRKPMFAIMDRINSRICASWFLASSLIILSRVINAVGNYAFCVLTTQRPLNDHSTTTQRPLNDHSATTQRPLSDHSTTTQTTTQNPLPPLFIKQWTRLNFMPF